MQEGSTPWGRELICEPVGLPVDCIGNSNIRPERPSQYTVRKQVKKEIKERGVRIHPLT